MQSYVRESKINYDSNDNVLSYLTMAHILGRVVEEFALSMGAHIGYWQALFCFLDRLLEPLLSLNCVLPIFEGPMRLHFA